jgi:hypothetical protein
MLGFGYSRSGSRTMFALQATCPSDVDCGAQRFGDETAGIAVRQSIPMLRLMLDFAQCGLPAILECGWDATTGFVAWLDRVHVRDSS